jgi:hypothetical protein
MGLEFKQLHPNVTRLQLSQRQVDTVTWRVSKQFYQHLNKKFWEELIAQFPLIQHGSHRNGRVQQFFFSEGKCLSSRCLATIRGGTQTEPYTLLWYNLDRIENDVSNNSSTVVCILCSGNVFTEPLPSNDMRATHTDRDWCEGFMKYAAEMDSDAMILVHTKFHKDCCFTFRKSFHVSIRLAMGISTEIAIAEVIGLLLTN